MFDQQEQDTRELDAELRARIEQVCEEGRAHFDRFQREVRGERWHPYIPIDYDLILRSLVPLRQPGRRFLEWGSATGVVTVIADLLGFDACGIELDAELVEVARALAAKHGSSARFAAGSFIPAGYRWQPADGDARLGTIGEGRPAYAELGLGLADFDVVYGYPWAGERPMMIDLFRSEGRAGARLLVPEDDVIHTYQAGADRD
jgi:hypothetical protein